MTRLASISLVLGMFCLGAVAWHARLITTSVKVGWNDTGTAQFETKAELRQLSDPEALRQAAETFAGQYGKMTEASARYIVYFYAALAALGLALGTIAYLARSASNSLWRGP